MKNKKRNSCTTKPAGKKSRNWSHGNRNRASPCYLLIIILILDRETNIFAQAIAQPKNHAQPKAAPKIPLTAPSPTRAHFSWGFSYKRETSCSLKII